jgi:hypothetical protein
MCSTNQSGEEIEEMVITLLFCYTYPDTSKTLLWCNVLYAAVQHSVTITLKKSIHFTEHMTA